MADKKKVLVVDDEQNLILLVRSLLEPEGLEVVGKTTGQQCLDSLAEEKPDLVLLDIMMPNMSGLEVARRMRRDPKTSGIPIAFLTVVSSDELSPEVLREVKALDYIKKPFNNDDFRKRIKAIL